MEYQATIKKQAMWAIFDIKGNASAVAKRIADICLSLPSSANTAYAKNGQHLCWIGEDHWLLLAPSEMEFQLLERLDPQNSSLDCRIVHVSDAYTLFKVTGNHADDILAIASPLNTRQQNFPIDGATYTEFFGIRGLVLRWPDGYLTAVERSYADMINAYFDKIMTGSR
ncbi:MAG: sarcosine oxidase subunit gamma family protein [Candidatus Puniceispirillum sp.]